MTQETLLGSDFSVHGHSPQKEQKFDNQNSSKVIRSNSELLVDVLTSTPLEIVNDVKAVYKDFKKSVSEHLRLHFDPLYYGLGVPRGNGDTVVHVGGLWSNVLHYFDRTVFLKRIDYNSVPYPWGPLNVIGPKEAGKKLLAFLVKEANQNGGRVIGDGHSLGVYQLLAAFSENPEQFVDSVKHLVLNGGPWPTRINRAVETIFLLSRSPFRTDDDFEIGEKAPLLFQAEAAGDIKITSINSSDDPIIQGIPFGRPESQFVLPGASHSFLAGNSASLRVTAYSLAGREEELIGQEDFLQARVA